MAFKRNNNVIDSPDNNFATFNPLLKLNSTDPSDPTPSGLSLEKGSLKSVSSGSEGFTYYTALSNIAIPATGKWFVEVCPTSLATGATSRSGIGIIDSIAISSSQKSAAFYYTTSGSSYAWQANGDVIISPSTSSSYQSPYANGDIIGVLYDADSGTLSFYKDGTDQGEAFTGITGQYYFGVGYWGDFIINFGQDHTFSGTKTNSAGFSPTDGSPGLFYYEPPEGAKALCSANLSTTVENSQEHFKAVTYIGNGIDGNEVTDVGFQSDLIWIKDRDNTSQSVLVDSVRGYNKEIFSTMTKVEQTNANRGSYKSALSEINTAGFVLNSNVGPTGSTNDAGSKHIAWCWKAGGGGGKYNIDGVPYIDFANTGLTAGDIEPTGMSINTKAGFSIIKYSGNSTPNATVPHGLSSKVEFSIIKVLNDSQAWSVFHKDAGGGLMLNMTNEAGDGYDHSASGDNFVSFGSGWDGVNGSKDYILYCWHSIPGYSAFGSYEANGSTDGPFTYTGFKPAFVMIKRTDVGNGWEIHDNARDPHNPSGEYLMANETSYSFSSASKLDLLSNGFKIRTNGNSTNTPDGGSYIYMAFAEHSM